MDEDELEDSTPDAFDTWYSEIHGGADSDLPDYDSMDDSRE